MSIGRLVRYKGRLDRARHHGRQKSAERDDNMEISIFAMNSTLSIEQTQ